MPAHKKDSDLIVSTPEFKRPDNFENAVAVISNLIARATTQWNLEESKLFILAVSQIEERDDECRVKFKKKDIVKMLGIDPRKTSDLRQKLINVKDKSQVEFYGQGADDWEAGNLIISVKTDRSFAYIRFNPYYIPLLHYVKDQLFTRFEIKNVMGFRHKSAYSLYLYLTSWHNENYLENARNINKSDIPKVFDLKEGQYWRGYGTEKEKFDWATFERYCLKPAIEDINSNPYCDMKIDSWMKVKDPDGMKYVLGYAFKWHYQNPDGTLKIKENSTPVLRIEDACTFEDLNHAYFFMKHFKRLNERQLKALSKAMGTVTSFFDGHNPPLEHPSWTVSELKQEQSQECISAKLCRDIHNILYRECNYDEFAKLFGYEKNDKTSDIGQSFMEDLGGVKAKVECV